MLSAARAVAKATETGSPLPELDQLADLYADFDFHPGFGELTVIAGEPGTQKSGFALYWVANMGLPTIYFSADSAAHTAVSRTVACLTGEKYRDILGALEEESGQAYCEDILSDAKIEFCFDPDPTMETIRDEIFAWVEMYDNYPKVMIVDNLMDVVSDNDNEYAGYKEILLVLKRLARETGAAIFVLHHMSESNNASDHPPPRKSLMGKAAQTPENIMSVDLEGDQFRVSVVKARSGESDKTGRKFVTLVADPARNQFRRQQSLDQQTAAIAEWHRQNVS